MMPFLWPMTTTKMYTRKTIKYLCVSFFSFLAIASYLISIRSMHRYWNYSRKKSSTLIHGERIWEKAALDLSLTVVFERKQEAWKSIFHPYPYSGQWSAAKTTHACVWMCWPLSTGHDEYRYKVDTISSLTVAQVSLIDGRSKLILTMCKPSG